MTIENIEVKVGDEVRVGMQLMTVDEITEFDTVVVIDQDGGELELTVNEIDIYKQPKPQQPKNENTNELIFEGWHSDEKETFTGVRNDSHGNDCRDHDQDAWNYEIDESDCWK